MKIFGWVQNKLNGKPVKKVPTTYNYPVRKEDVQEEFSDWPQGLLTIGTFGKNEEKEISETQAIMKQQDPPTSPDLSEFTPEEVGKLQESLTKLLSRKSASKLNYNKVIMELPLDKFLNCPSSLEVERRLRSSFGCDLGDVETEEDINKTISVILGKCKEVSAAANKNKNIGKKSFSFLLKKMFVCSSGFAPPTPSLRDSLQETRMEKLLRAMIYKTRFPQPSTSRTSSATKYLENKSVQQKSENDDERRGESSGDRSKWVKTDSEYIVLEI